MNNNSKNVDTDDTEKCQVEQQEHKYTDSVSSTRRKVEDSDPCSQKQVLDHNDNSNNNDGTNLINAMVSEKKELQQLLYKVDSRIIPVISLCFTFSFMDRTNIGIYI